MASAPIIVLAEMPEAAGRDLAIERANLPADAQLRCHTFRGDVEALVEACRDADAILTDYVPFDAAVLARLPRCRLVAVMATGWDCVDVEAAARHGIRVAAVGEYCTQEVADHTFGLLLAMERRLADYHRQVQQERDWRWNAVTGLRRLEGLALGLLGFGRIGRAVCRRAQGFGLRVLACDPFVDAALIAAQGATPVGFERLLEESDILSLHANLTPQNRGLLDRTAFARLRRRPLLINVARGALVVEEDLVAALDAGWLRGAALDVLASESPDLEHHPLAGRPEVMLTPHVAFYSATAVAELSRIAASNVREFLAGRPDNVFRLVEPAQGGT